MSTNIPMLGFAGQGDPDPRQMVHLMREYLRRAACWTRALGCEDAWPFFDIAAKVQSEARARAISCPDPDTHDDLEMIAAPT